MEEIMEKLMDPTTQLKDKIAIVTGGARGLGEAISRSLAQSGAHVYVADKRFALAEQVAEQVRESGGRATALSFDVTEDEKIDEGLRFVLSRHGRLDIIVNNAGVDRTTSIEEMEISDWDQIMSVNLRAPFVVSKKVLPVMREQASGHIINIVSTAAKRCWPNASAYHASKWGLLGFTHALHTEARPHKVKVTAVICGGMRTPFLLERFPDIDLETLQDPQAVADTIRFVLCAPQGTVIPEIMALPMGETSWP
jgi:NAD(P)-dependent dehydrogenase (short-subunit alcohol dehydrogenase family)